ncbi:hypothetical protein L208DRAFT_1385111 [Tricholoma matsutake]|nr:hypothetical protein L208DRAFT_1385111 [Tricholoma matsutake 945]
MVPKARACSVKVEEIEDEDSTCNINARNSGISPTSSFQILGMKKNSKSAGQNMKRSLIHLFYKIVTNGPAESFFHKISSCQVLLSRSSQVVHHMLGPSGF